ncbi:MAG TPA: hypothetical protein PLG90_12640 [Ignavibacteria bacterium]|nr:hypothetical protein [Ignavibacteria bacterium]
MFFSKVYFADTNNFFYLDWNRLYHYKENSITFNPLPEIPNHSYDIINGNNNQELIIAGSKLKNNIIYPTLFKRINMILEEIPIKDTNSNFIHNIDYINGKYYLSTKNRVLWVYDMNELKEIGYSDTNFAYSYVFDDGLGNYYMFGLKEFYNPEETHGYATAKIYKILNNNLELVFDQNYPGLNDGGEGVLYPSKVGNEILATDRKSVYKFTGTNYIKILDLPQQYMYSSSLHKLITGNNSSDFMIRGINKQNNRNTIYHWNGTKWSKENTTFLFINSIELVNNIYMISYDNVTLLGVGKLLRNTP